MEKCKEFCKIENMSPLWFSMDGVYKNKKKHAGNHVSSFHNNKQADSIFIAAMFGNTETWLEVIFSTIVD